MNWYEFSLIFFVVVITLVVGYLVFQLFFKRSSLELDVREAFKQNNFQLVYELTKGLCASPHSYSLDMFLWAAQSCVELKKYEEALTFYQTLRSSKSLSKSDQILVTIEIGQAYEKLRNFDQAEITYREACAIDKDDRARYLLAFVLFKKKDYAICRKLLRELLKDNPYLVDARRLYAECLAELFQYAKAIKHYALLERTNMEEVSYNYLKTLVYLKSWDKAYEIALKLLDSPHYEEVILNLCVICLETKKYQQCLEFIQQYQAKVKNEEIQNELAYIKATVHYRRGDQIKALQEYHQLYSEHQDFKDLSQIMEQEGYLLRHPDLEQYFTSNTTQFEDTIAKVTTVGQLIVYRSLDYYLAETGRVAYLFYRHIKKMPLSIIDEADSNMIRLCPHVEQLQIWSLSGIDEKYSVAKQAYATDIIAEDVFIKKITDHIHDIQFKQGIPNLLYAVPKNEAMVEKILENDLNDDLLNQSL